LRVVLINPNARGQSRLMLPVPPLGVTTLAAMARARGHAVEVWDQFAARESAAAVAARLAREPVDLVGFSVLTPAEPMVREVVWLYRLQGGTARVVLGGVHATVFHRELVDAGIADVVVRREGEGPFGGLLAALESGRPLGEVAGLTFRDAGRTVATDDAEQLRDIDALPVPAWDLVREGLDVYAQAPSLGLYGRSLPILASRGCPRRCSFCGQEIFHKGVRVRGLDSVIAEIDALGTKHGAKNFVFLDANFPVSRGHGHRFCDALIASGLHRAMGWSTELKVDLVDRDLLFHMREAGCRNVEYGFEVGSETVLEATDKGTRVEHALEAMRLTKETGIHAFGLFMIGLPGETTKDVWRTFRLARRLDCEMAKFNITIPYPGTALFERHRAELLARFDPETYNAWFVSDDPERKVTVVPGGLSAERLLLLQRLLMFGYYLRPRVLLRHLRRRSLSPAHVLMGLGFLVQGLTRGIAGVLRAPVRRLTRAGRPA
jgi:radical SAM superfamily enzyme YgiQ (UPF0313 family)